MSFNFRAHKFSRHFFFSRFFPNSEKRELMSRKFAVIRYEVFEYPELAVMTFTSRGNGNELGYET